MDMTPRDHRQLEPPIIDPVGLCHGYILELFVLEQLDPLRPSSEMGADLYTEALELVFLRLEELSDT